MMFVLVTALLLEISMTSQAVDNMGSFNPSLTRPLGAAKYNMSRYQYEDLLITGQAPFPSRQVPQKQQGYPLYALPPTLSDTHGGRLILPRALNHRLPLLPTKPPRFMGPETINVSAVPGETVVLPCRLIQIGRAKLSWLKRPQLTVLTSGSVMFTSSPRISLLHSEGSPDWNLQIGPVNMKDSGTYECQVNTDPKQSRWAVLDVSRSREERDGGRELPALALQGHIVASSRRQKTEILAPAHTEVYEGGTATLECVVTEHVTPPAFFTWYIGNKALDFSQHRGGILLQNEQKTRSSASRITLTKMVAQDSAVYTCSPATADNASVTVTVVPRPSHSMFSEDSSNASWSLDVRNPLLYLLLLFVLHNLAIDNIAC